MIRPTPMKMMVFMFDSGSGASWMNLRMFEMFMWRGRDGAEWLRTVSGVSFY